MVSGNGSKNASCSGSFTIQDTGYYIITFTASQANKNEYYTSQSSSLTVNNVSVGTVISGNRTYSGGGSVFTHSRLYEGQLSAGDVIKGTFSCGTWDGYGTSCLGVLTVIAFL